MPQSVVEISPMRAVPEASDMLEWDRYNSYNFSDEHFDLMEPSKFAQASPALSRFMAKHGLGKTAGDPLSALRLLNRKIYEAFDYQVGVTDVHSPIGRCARCRRGVCQDFAHI